MVSELQKALKEIQGASPPVCRTDAPRLVAELEGRYSVRLPEEFRSYLIEAAGADGWTDNVGLGWYPIEHIKSLTELSYEELAGANVEVAQEAHKYLVFADFLDWCGYGYAICCSDGPNRGYVAIVYPSPGRFICRTFSTFLRLVAADSDRLHSPAGDYFTEIV